MISKLTPNVFLGIKMIKVEYDKGKCIGIGSCEAIAPENFKVEDGKADLLNSKDQGKDIFTSEVSKEKKELLIEAAKNCPVNAIRIIDESGKDLVSIDIKTDQIQEIKAEHDDLKEFKMDPKGYFLIKVNKEKNRVEVGHCGELNKVDIMVYGNKPIDIYMTIIKKGLVEEMGHAAYLGREIQKACIALKKNLKYVQDDELEL